MTPSHNASALRAAGGLAYAGLAEAVIHGPRAAYLAAVFEASDVPGFNPSEEAEMVLCGIRQLFLLARSGGGDV